MQKCGLCIGRSPTVIKFFDTTQVRGTADEAVAHSAASPARSNVCPPARHSATLTHHPIISLFPILLGPRATTSTPADSHSSNGSFYLYSPRFPPQKPRHMPHSKAPTARGAIASAVLVAARFMRPAGWMSIIVLLVCHSALGEGKFLPITAANVFVTFSHRAQGYRCIIFSLFMVLIINAIPSAAASQAAAQLCAQKPSESWATVLGIAVAFVGVALAIVSTSWLSRNRVPDFEGQQQPEPALDLQEAILDIEQALVGSGLRINERSFEDVLALPTITE